MRKKIEEIVRQMNHGEIEPEDGIDKLCDLHLVSHSYSSGDKCKHNKTLDAIHCIIKTNRDYWLFTELFCLLHNDSDVCNCG